MSAGRLQTGKRVATMRRSTTSCRCVTGGAAEEACRAAAEEAWNTWAVGSTHSAPRPVLGALWRTCTACKQCRSAAAACAQRRQRRPRPRSTRQSSRCLRRPQRLVFLRSAHPPLHRLRCRVQRSSRHCRSKRPRRWPRRSGSSRTAGIRCHRSGTDQNSCRCLAAPSRSGRWAAGSRKPIEPVLRPTRTRQMARAPSVSWPAAAQSAASRRGIP